MFGGIPTLEFAQVIADGIKDQRLRIRARRRGRHSLETISFELCIIRKLERKPLHLAALNDLGRHGLPRAAGGVRSVLVGEGL